jgi:hypothetical protein
MILQNIALYLSGEVLTYMAGFNLLSVVFAFFFELLSLFSCNSVANLSLFVLISQGKKRKKKKGC